MIKGNILFNSTAWAYDFINQKMTALRGHKYHILPTSSSPFIISGALLMLFLTLVFNFHGAKISSTFFDSLVQLIINGFNRLVFGKKILKNSLYPSDTINEHFASEFFSYNAIHFLWVGPFLVTLGCFFFWSSNAIFEGISSKINFFSFWKNSVDVSTKILVEPLFHTNLVRKSFKIGFILFIISEVMFFFGFFWAFFHSSISPTIQIGAVWPPLEVEFITVKGFAVANTVILLTSGATLTIAHYGFELIPQKKNKLFTSNVAFADSEQVFEERLNEEYTKINDSLFDSSKPEVVSLPFLKWISLQDKISNLAELNSIIVPFNILLNPFQRYFQRNLGLKDTENLVRIYISLMLNATLVLAVLFMLFQGTEYFISPVNINTGVYGSTFYMITGLHGAHVFIGTCFLFYCWIAVSSWRTSSTFYIYFSRLINIIVENMPTPQFIKEFQLRLIQKPTRYSVSIDVLYESLEISSKPQDLLEITSSLTNYGKYGVESFESAAWYWHFVDVVWVFVFGFVYVWSHLTVLDLQ